MNFKACKAEKTSALFLTYLNLTSIITSHLVNISRMLEEDSVRSHTYTFAVTSKYVNHFIPEHLDDFR